MNTKKICSQLNVTQKLLRTYEDHGIITPMRGENNYRAYSIDDVVKIKCIMLLREFGFSYGQIRTILNESSNPSNRFDQTFYIHLKTVERKIQELEETKTNLKRCINDFLSSGDDVSSALTTIINFQGNVRTDDNELSDFSWDFDNLADSYDENVIMRTPEHQKALHTLRSYILEHSVAKHSKILDVGCGSCYLWHGTKDKHLHITGMDNSLRMIFCAREKLPWIKFMLADILENDLPDNPKFDLVTSSYTLHHIPYKHQYTAISNMLSVMDHHGQLVLMDRMFYDAADAQILRNYYIQAGEFRKLSDMTTEFFPYVNHLLSFFEANGYHATTRNIDKGVWMIIVTQQ
ncbi:MerR family transcriptional regulator [Hydrogenoanaerobacterium sp.]|uniref:MerR family transcriptional regulator n=1 Tax=Hydrogenoanaerobacterium sp. TaxID=2953763 RepID=UPI002898C781|nr:MerR family transcriptional regulator [Hydrogenoanaerobacterium sp.]